MIKVLFFAQVRELVNTDELSLPCDYATAEDLRAALCERGERCTGAGIRQTAVCCESVFCAVVASADRW